MRFKLKIEEQADSAWPWKGTLYVDPPGSRMEAVSTILSGTREEVIAEAKERKARMERLEEQRPEWLSLDDVPEPQSIRVA